MKLIRDDLNDARTFGAFYTDEGQRLCDTLELPYRDNAHNVSSIPAGTFPVAYKWSPVHGRNLWHVEVPGRDSIELHIGNSVIDTDGCILLGTSRGRLLCKDGVTRDAVLGSHGAFDAFMARDPSFAAFTLDVSVS